GQVLQAVLPAGVRDRAGTRKAVLVEAVPAADLPDPAPKLTTKQASVLEYLRRAGEPLEQRHLSRQTRCGPGVVDALAAKGLVRKSTQQVEREPEDDRPPNGLKELVNALPIVLNPDQLRAWAPVERAVRDGGFKAF